MTVEEVCGGFLDYKEKDVQHGLIKPCTLRCYRDAVSVIYIGLNKKMPANWMNPKRWREFRNFIAKGSFPSESKERNRPDAVDL